VADLETEVPRLLEPLWLSLVEMLVVVEEEEEDEDEDEDAKEDAAQVAAKDEEAFEALEQAELAFAPLVDVPRDFFVGGSSREPFIEFRLP